MKKKWRILGGVVTFVAGAVATAAGVSYKIFRDTMGRDGHLGTVPETTEEDPFRYMTEEGKKWAIAHKEYCNRLTLINEGVELVGYYYANSKETDTDKTVILVHGLTGSYLDRLFKADIYYNRGYNVLAVDCRGHGESGGEYRTMGHKDSDDVICWAKYLINEQQQKMIVLDGVSMGAATVLTASGSQELPGEVAGVVADCGFTSIYEIYKYQAEHFLHIPSGPALVAMEKYSRKYAKVPFKEKTPLQAVAKSHTPTLFIHGVDDDFVPYEMGVKLCRKCKAPKKMFSVKGAGHGECVLVDTEGYTEVLEEFLETLE